MRLPTWTGIATALVLIVASVARADVARAGAADAAASALSRDGDAATRAGEASSKWIVDRADNICGLDDAKMLSKPAKVEYDTLLKATSEMKKVRDDKIDANSPEGIRLRQAAVDRVRTACDKVRVAEGYCSVWKQIRHQDGRTIPDITDLVKAQL
jgi:hypothetical protein